NAPRTGSAAVFHPVEVGPLATLLFSTCVVFQDLDGDGLPDLFLIPASDGVNPITAALALHNTGGDFQPSMVALRPLAMAGSCAAGDIDNDGLPDVYIPGLGTSILLHNRGGLVFDDISDASGTRHKADSQKPDQGITATFLDYDGDGRLDLYTAYRPTGGMGMFSCEPSEHDF